ncbi:ubiquitin-conjugating enzyme/RWD-like protein [Multifurca ochricompacta]|uniref:E2 ubiquitin-conjugating enzyme n=1 Tax=Multifurca ochricompacta TaxID=376703 RepID=A0AAD4M3M1_9AGAM|nr:ubiquitin-conjugating enzyme/RWD-like protein [Multifurca ochricompacta]
MSISRFSGTTLKRIHREIADLKKEDLGGISVGPVSNDIPFLWRARIPGPEGSVYEGGIFNVDITLGYDYPFSAPKVIFKTLIYHMNISDKGNVCIDILKNNWSPALSIFKVVLSLSSLLTDPNPSDPLVPSIATEFLRNRSTHDRTARQWTDLYAKPPPSPPPSPPPLSPSAASSNSPSSYSITNRSSAKGKGRANVHSAGTEGLTETQTIGIDLTSEGVETTPIPEVGSSSSRGGKRRHVEKLGDVIVIED